MKQVSDEATEKPSRWPLLAGSLGVLGDSWRALRNERRVLVAVMALSTLVAQAESAVLVTIALVAGSVGSQQDVVSISFGPVMRELPVNEALFFALAALAAAAVVAALSTRVTVRVFARIDRQTRDEVFLSYAGADWESQAQQGAGTVQGLLRLTPSRARLFNALVTWVRAACAITVFVLIAVVVNPIGAAVTLILGLALSLGLAPLRRASKRTAGGQAHTEVSLAENAAQAIDQGADAAVFGAWPAFTARWSGNSRRLEELTVRVSMLAGIAPLIYQYGGFLIVLAVLALSATLQPESVGALAATALLLLRSVQYGQQLQAASVSLAGWLPFVERLVRSLPPTVNVRRYGDQRLDEIVSVELRDVSYSYPGAPADAVHDVTMELPSHGVIGLAGRSGSGKSTIGQILLRLRRPQKGAYRINGVDADAYDAIDWHRHVLHVPQQPRLLDASVFDNVAYFDPRISRGRALDALNAVGLGGLVEQLPDGLDTMIGPTLRGLSGGQAQRIGIARALARDPLFLLLDEPTSALDNESEQLIADALEALRGRRRILIVIIAHRPSTLALCDRVLLLDDGRVVTAGLADEIESARRSQSGVPTMAEDR